MGAMVKRVLLASPRGYCAGVERAVDTVEKLLDLHGPPIYVRKQIVHNAHVVRDLEARGAIFVDDERACGAARRRPRDHDCRCTAIEARRRGSVFTPVGSLAADRDRAAV